MITRLKSPPLVAELSRDFPSPFAALGPVTLARLAGEAMQAELQTGAIAPGISAAVLFAPAGGKMFGVLVVEQPGGGLGFLRAFSGMLAGRWEVAGFVPPLFDAAARAQVEPAGE